MSDHPKLAQGKCDKNANNVQLNQSCDITLKCDNEKHC